MRDRLRALWGLFRRPAAARRGEPVPTGPFEGAGDPGLPKLLVNSMPKSGTHLLGKLAGLLGLRDLNIHLNDTFYWDYKQEGDAHDWAKRWNLTKFLNPKGVQQPSHEALGRLQRGQFLLAHIRRTAANVDALARHGVKHLFIYRDPRDILVSFVEYATRSPDKNPPRAMCEYFNERCKTDEQRHLALIRGVPGVMDSLHDINKNLATWVDDPACCALAFEDLVGAQGGGSQARQRATLDRVLAYLGVPAEGGVGERVAAQLFGGRTHTFNKGQIGSWRESLSRECLLALRESDGPLMRKLGYDPDEGL